MPRFPFVVVKPVCSHGTGGGGGYDGVGEGMKALSYHQRCNENPHPQALLPSSISCPVPGFCCWTAGRGGTLRRVPFGGRHGDAATII